MEQKILDLMNKKFVGKKIRIRKNNQWSNPKTFIRAIRLSGKSYTDEYFYDAYALLEFEYSDNRKSKQRETLPLISIELC